MRDERTSLPLITQHSSFNTRLSTAFEQLHRQILLVFEVADVIYIDKPKRRDSSGAITPTTLH